MAYRRFKEHLTHLKHGKIEKSNTISHAIQKNLKLQLLLLFS